MSTPVRLPQWGMAMQDGVIVEWLKLEGDHVTKGDPLVEVEVAKVTDHVLAPTTGVLVRIVATPGQTVEIQGLLAEIEEDG
jgi:pyruvate dehydrogenase E2 component (dihydrolipoamide acetyltransferase)